MASKIEPDDGAIAQARLDYDAGRPLAEIARSLPMSLKTFAARRKQWGWPERHATRGKAKAADTASSADAASEGDAKPASTLALSRRVEAAVRHELTAVEKRLGTATASAAEKNARILASLVKSLSELRKLERDEATHRQSQPDGASMDEQPPLDMARLRQELEDNLARIQAQRDAARGGANPET